MRTIRHTLFYIALVSLSRLSAQSNIDFELTPAGTYTSASGVGGWTLSSQMATSCNFTAWTPGSPEFAILNTPIISVPYIGNIPQSPLGGAKIACLNNTIANSSVTKLSKTFMVTPFDQVLAYAFAGAWESTPTGHQCCEESGFKAILKDQFGTVIPCVSTSMVPGLGCQMAGATFSVTNGTAWSNWQTKYVDLTPFLNTPVTLEVIACDCIFSTHYGTVYFDARLQSGNSMPCNCVPTPVPTMDLWFCPGSNQAQLHAPLGYVSYSWSPPSGAPAIPSFQATMSSLFVANPIVGSVYTLNLLTQSGCVFIKTYTVAPTTVGISGLGTNSTCAAGWGGSATVSATGSGSGFNYSWINSTSSVVGTASVANNLFPGNYTVSVTAFGPGSSSCGTATAAVTIGTVVPSQISVIKSFCGNAAYLCAPTGTNYQWYNTNLSPFPPPTGTAPCFTLFSPTPGLTLRTAFTNTYGCRDSLAYVLISTPLGSLNVTQNIICPNATNGVATLFLSPASGAPFGVNSYSVFATGTTSPYYASVPSTSAYTFAASGLNAGGTYSVKVFDGACNYSTTFSVTPFTFSYTVSPSSATVCSGNVVVAAVSLTTPASAGQYLYSWSPNTFVVSPGMPMTFINPIVAAGTSTNITYSITVTPTLVNCPLTKTLSITAANPQTPTISPVPSLCNGSGPFTVNVNPPNGVFSGGSNFIGVSSGIITPSLATLGINTFTYANSIGTCVAKSSASFVVNSAPSLTLSGNSAICVGQSLTLLANGANTYTWSNSSNSPFITVSPSVNTTYTVVGTMLSSNCSNVQSIPVLVVQYPTLTVVSTGSICAGSTATLTASGADSYLWSNGTSNSITVVSPTTSSSYTVTGLANLAPCSSTQVAIVSVSNCVVNTTGVGELTQNDFIKIYPNPTNGKLFVEMQTKTTVLLIDQLGRKIFEREFEKGNYNLDLGNYPNGVYFVKATYNGETKITKLVKND